MFGYSERRVGDRGAARDNLPAERRAEVVAKQRRIISVVETLVREIRPETGSITLSAPLTMLFFGMINWTHTWFRPGAEERRCRSGRACRARRGPDDERS